jgi:hypothetical protein
LVGVRPVAVPQSGRLTARLTTTATVKDALKSPGRRRQVTREEVEGGPRREEA